MLVLLTRRIYELRRCDWVRCLDVRTKFHKDWLGIHKLIREGLHIVAQTYYKL
jgi:hypothetical protein